MTDYHRDRVAWTEEQGQLLRRRSLTDVDRSNVAAELQALFVEDAGMLRLRVRILLTALLRWAYQPDLRSTSLAATIMTQRDHIDQIIGDSATLRSTLDQLVTDVYPEAKHIAVVESGLFDESFPDGLPFLLHEVTDYSFMPDPFRDDNVTLSGKTSMSRTPRRP